MFHLLLLVVKYTKYMNKNIYKLVAGYLIPTRHILTNEPKSSQEIYDEVLEIFSKDKSNNLSGDYNVTVRGQSNYGDEEIEVKLYVLLSQLQNDTIRLPHETITD